jgi:hypothetical protein
MGPAERWLTQTASGGIAHAGDRLVDLVHRAVTGQRVRGDPERALDSLVKEGALSPEAALYVGAFRQALCELSRTLKQ